ncbi:phosphoglycolate phosphatase [Castellaniella sp.]|uniref:phosphoglycolate phosphatase n=1 Tax=Castellaniella sp. TaxID=1955812 RepID=UPI003562A829
MHMPLNAVHFDLDGTLLDTLPDIAAAINAMRQDFGEPPLAQDTIAVHVGKGSDTLVARILGLGGRHPGPLQQARALDRYLAHYARLNGREARLYPGVVAGLRLFRDHGCAMAVVTNKPTAFTHPLLEQFELLDYFDAIVCGDTCATKKPDPAPLLHACTLLNEPAENTLFIGDSINDALAAQAAGMRMLALPYGYNEGRSAHTLPADAVVDTLEDAAAWALDTAMQGKVP